MAKGVGVALASAMGQITDNSHTRRAERERDTHTHKSKTGAGVEEERVEEQDLVRHHSRLTPGERRGRGFSMPWRRETEQLGQHDSCMLGFNP